MYVRISFICTYLFVPWSSGEAGVVMWPSTWPDDAGVSPRGLVDVCGQLKQSCIQKLDRYHWLGISCVSLVPRVPDCFNAWVFYCVPLKDWGAWERMRVLGVHCTYLHHVTVSIATSTGHVTQLAGAPLSGRRRVVWLWGSGEGGWPPDANWQSPTHGSQHALVY